MKVPSNPPPSMVARTLKSALRQNCVSPNRSMKIRIGSIMPAARTGAIASAIKGTARPAKAPANPPLEMPFNRTAGIATR